MGKTLKEQLILLNKFDCEVKVCLANGIIEGKMGSVYEDYFEFHDNVSGYECDVTYIPFSRILFVKSVTKEER
jgi:hypothetical protein